MTICKHCGLPANRHGRFVPTTVGSHAFERAECEVCGEALRDGQEWAEMYDPRLGDDAPNVLCHGECGAAQGLEVA